MERQETPAWLRCHTQPFDRGVRAAKCPYSSYSPIDTDNHCIEVTRDETQKWDTAFQLALKSRLCQLIVLLNRSIRFQTSHTVIGSEAPQKFQGYEWATNSLGVSITIISREPAPRFSLDEQVQIVRVFYQAISAMPFKGDSTGWLLGIWPEVVMYEDERGGPDIRGYGIELRAWAFANNERASAERLARLLAWITEVFLHTQEHR